MSDYPPQEPFAPTKQTPGNPQYGVPVPGANPYAGGYQHGSFATGQGAPGPVYQVTGEQIGDGTGGLIPYKNPKALLAYYLGICSMLPLLGFPFGVASIWLGIKGLKARKANPIIKGSVHAWIGIVLGTVFMPLHLLFGTGLVVALIGAVQGGGR